MITVSFSVNSQKAQTIHSGMTATTMSTEDIRKILSNLLSRWEQHNEVFAGRKGAMEDQLIITYTLAAHTHRLASTVLLLQEHERRLEAIPLVRSAMEHALTTQWLAQYQDAIRGYMHEGLRQHKSLLSRIAAAGWKKASDALTQFDQIEGDKHPAHDAARYVERLCNDLEPAGDEAYSMYKILCAYTHPTPRIAEAYLLQDPLRLSREPVSYDQSDWTVWLFITCASTMWAARAVDILEKGSPRMNELRSVARLLGVTPQFQLSLAFRRREQDQKWARRQDPKKR